MELYFWKDLAKIFRMYMPFGPTVVLLGIFFAVLIVIGRNEKLRSSEPATSKINGVRPERHAVQLACSLALPPAVYPVSVVCRPLTFLFGCGQTKM